MNALEATRALLSAAPDALFVASLGTPTSALRAASDDGPHLYMGGAMGTALAAAIGVADKRPDRPVVALLGDGETLMGANSLWSLAGIQPGNLLAAVLADGHYSITGGQRLGVPGASPRSRAPSVSPPRSPTVATRSSARSARSPGRRCSRSATTSASGPDRRRSSIRPSSGTGSRRPPRRAGGREMATPSLAQTVSARQAHVARY